MRIGQRIADALPKAMPLKSAAAALGVSVTYVRRLECQALYKVQARFKELLQHQNDNE